MDNVFVKIKGRANKSIFKLLSEHTLYEKPIIQVKYCIPYAPDHKLDEDSWFKIDEFSKQKYCVSFLKGAFDSKDFDELQKEQFKRIDYIFSNQGDDFYFQKTTPACFIHKKMISFGEFAEIVEDKTRLVVNELPDAIYYKNEDALIFKRLTAIASIFKGIDILYKEATNQEVEEFLNESFIGLASGYGTNAVSKPNRKRIAMALDTLEAMSAEDKKSMHLYINEYCSEKIKYDGETSKYTISNDDELKLLLYGIEQRFYTTPFSKEKKLANSTIDL